MLSAIHSIFKGVFTGAILYLLLIIGDLFFNTQTERLLLNIDFLTHKRDTPIWIELIPHFAVSIMIYTILAFAYSEKRLFKAAMIFCLIAFIVLFILLTQMALYYEYTITIQMFFVWMIGHILYLVIVYKLILHEVKHANI